MFGESRNTLEWFGECSRMIRNGFGHIWKVPEGSRIVSEGFGRVQKISKGWKGPEGKGAEGHHGPWPQGGHQGRRIRGRVE
jgi:hypothetical protein